MLFAPLKAQRQFNARCVESRRPDQQGLSLRAIVKTVLRVRKQLRRTGLQAAADGHLCSTPLGIYPERRRRTARTVHIQYLICPGTRASIPEEGNKSITG